MHPEERSLIRSFLPGVVFASILWMVKILEWQQGISLHEWGVFPRELMGLPGIITMPFIHDDFKHIFSNTIPLVILSACMAYFYREMYIRAFLMIWLLSGTWLWIGGRPAWHIGASAIVYGMASFVFLSGIIRRSTHLMALSLLVVFLYGGMVWGMFPWFFGVSWEGHLFGTFAGILCAWYFRKEGWQRKQYDWENETDDDEESINENEEMVPLPPDENSNVSWSTGKEETPPTVIYHFHPATLPKPQETIIPPANDTPSKESSPSD